MARLSIVSGRITGLIAVELQLAPDEPVSIELSQRGIGFGRSAAPMNWDVPWVQLAARGVGRHHTKLSFEDGAWWVEHSGTSNPTFVNREPVKRARLASGDVIDVSNGATLRFVE